MPDLSLYIALGSIGIGLGIVGWAIIKSLNLGYKAASWEKDFYRARDDNKSLISQMQVTEAERNRIHEAHEIFKTEVAAALESGNWNSVLKDASISNVYVGASGVEKTTNNDHE